MKTEEIFRVFEKSTGVSTDSRSIKKGQLFFALPGPSFDGNRFAGDALRAGAVAAVIDNPEYEADNTILVDDTLSELQLLAARVRYGIKAEIIAITGSNGKTTTRQLITAVLATKYKTFSTPGNLNNHIGVPLSILACPPHTEFLVLEMGASHHGEIAQLCSIAQPDAGLITNIGKAHIEGFGSVEGVMKAKSELFDYLKSTGGIALYDDDDPLLTEIVIEKGLKAVPYSKPSGKMLKINTKTSDLILEGDIIFDSNKYKFKSNLFGVYNHHNIKAAIAAGLYYGVSITEIISAIDEFRPSGNRSQIVKTEKNILICDSYNANPVSMTGAVKAFIALKAENKICIAGDMLELGPDTDIEHETVLKLLRDSNIKRTIIVGPVMKKMAKSFGFEAFETVSELVQFLRLNPINGNIILIKGSRGVRLEETYSVL